MPTYQKFAEELELFPDPQGIDGAFGSLADAGVEGRGAIYTRREVVDFILDLVGYEPSSPLHRRRLLEPAFGRGDFLIPAITRLLVAWKREGGRRAEDLQDAVRGIELHEPSFRQTHGAVTALLRAEGLTASEAAVLVEAWLSNGDFLLAQIAGPFDFVVGNPPYVRQELIPGPLLAEYRRRYRTLFDRADLYVPFIERSLRELSERGKFGFICADRWMKNRYGGPLRRLVTERFHLDVYVDMVDTPAFLTDVAAYPAITIVSCGSEGPTRVARRPPIDAPTLRGLARRLRGESGDCASGANVDVDVTEVTNESVGEEPWSFNCDGVDALVRRMERTLPTLEAAGCKVGIGVATGADAAFIGAFDRLDVEEDRKLPLVMTRDIASGEVRWGGLGVVNPFADDGRLVRLADHPRLRRYLEDRREVIAGRHVARRAPENWFRTIDRIHPTLAAVPKLLIPDIKGGAHVVHERGQFYPHHNLYYITSETWDLRALRAVLISGIARLFVGFYSTRMRGGFLRFQAQYLRRIRVPAWSDVPPDLRRKLVDGSERGDREACEAATHALYGIVEGELPNYGEVSRGA